VKLSGNRSTYLYDTVKVPFDGKIQKAGLMAKFKRPVFGGQNFTFNFVNANPTNALAVT
jgi:hypothetical protein